MAGTYYNRNIFMQLNIAHGQAWEIKCHYYLILQAFLSATKIHYTVCILIRVVKTENSEMASISALTFHLHILYKAWQISLTSLVVINISCPLVQGRRSHLKATWALVHDTWQASLPKQPGNFQHHYLCMPKLLCDGENCVLLLCEWMPAFVKSCYTAPRRSHYW